MTMLFKFALVTLTVHCGDTLRKSDESQAMAESPKTVPSGTSGNPTSQSNTPALSQGCYYKQG